MPQDQSPDRRGYGPSVAEPGAAHIFDPVAFARRVELARAQRAEALARRDGGAPAAPDPTDAPSRTPLPPAPAASSDAAGRQDRVSAAAQAAFARSAAAPPLAAGRAHAGRAAAGDAVARPAPPQPTPPEPLVAPLRRPAPRRATGASRAAAVVLLFIGLVVAVAPPLRERAMDVAVTLLPSGVFAGVQLAEPVPPAGPPAQVEAPRLAALPDAPAAGATPAPTAAGPPERASDVPSPPALGRAALQAEAAQPAEPAQPRLGRLMAIDAQFVRTPVDPAGVSPTRGSDTPAPIPPAATAPDPAVSGLAAATPVVSGPVAADAALPEPAARTQVPRAADPLEIPRPAAADRADAAPAADPAATEPPTAGPAAPAAVAARVDPVSAAPVSSPSLAVHAPSTVSDADLAATIAALESARFGQVRGIRVGMTIERTHVRYFHAADAAAAQRLAAVVAPGTEVRDFTHFSPLPAPGRLEAWLSGAAAERRSPPPPPPPPPLEIAPAAPLPALPLAEPAAKLVIGRQSSVERTRPASPLLDQLYAPPAAAAPFAPDASPAPPPPAFDGGLY